MNETINGLLTQKPTSPAPVAGQQRRYEWREAAGKSGKPYMKVKASGEGYGQTCEVVSVQKTDFTDKFGNVSYNVEIKPQGEAQPAPNGNGAQPNGNGGQPASYKDVCRLELHVQEAAWKLARKLEQNIGEQMSDLAFVKIQQSIAMSLRKTGIDFPVNGKPAPEPESAPDSPGEASQVEEAGLIL